MGELKNKVSVQEYRAALEELKSRFDRDGVLIQDRTFLRRGEPVQLGVLWASIGEVAPADALAFAQRIRDAAAAADAFKYNGYFVEY